MEQDGRRFAFIDAAKKLERKAGEFKERQQEHKQHLATKPVKTRDTDLHPSDKMVDQVLENHPTAIPIQLVLSIIKSLGFTGVQSYDQQMTRAERFVSNNPNRRIPSHIRDKLIIRNTVNMALAKRFGV